ncbi:unnamed protein product [Urochloa humidicola]
MSGGAPCRAVTKVSCWWPRRPRQAAAADLGAAVPGVPTMAPGVEPAAFARGKRQHGDASSPSSPFKLRMLSVVFVMKGLKPFNLAAKLGNGHEYVCAVGILLMLDCLDSLACTLHTGGLLDC